MKGEQMLVMVSHHVTQTKFKPKKASSYKHAFEQLKHINRTLNIPPRMVSWIQIFPSSPTFHFHLEPRGVLLRRPVRSVANVQAGRANEEHHNLNEKPAPAAALLLRGRVDLAGLVRSAGAGTVRVSGVEVLRGELDEVVVICLPSAITHHRFKKPLRTAEVTAMRRESKVRNLRQRNIRHIEALHPLILRLILQLQLQIGILEVRQSRLSRNLRVAKTTSLPSPISPVPHHLPRPGVHHLQSNQHPQSPCSYYRSPDHTPSVHPPASRSHTGRWRRVCCSCRYQRTHRGPRICRRSRKQGRGSRVAW